MGHIQTHALTDMFFVAHHKKFYIECSLRHMPEASHRKFYFETRFENDETTDFFNFYTEHILIGSAISNKISNEVVSFKIAESKYSISSRMKCICVERIL